VADTSGQFVYSYSVEVDGSLTNKQRYYWLHMSDGATGSQADGMTVDTDGRLYVATQMGVQICDQAGRVNAIIPRPQNRYLSNVKFGGPNLDMLFVTCGDKVYKRKTKVKGALAFMPPNKPAAPRL
jgi:gluconolactonase